MRALLLFNSKARNGKADVSRGIEYLRKQGYSIDERRIDDPASIGDIILDCRNSSDLVVLGGGDGTLNAAAEALVECGLPLGIIPLGTANDLARTLGIPIEPLAACETIARRHTRLIDVGVANNKHFFNASHVGLSVALSARLTGAIKRRWGVFGYVLALADALKAVRSFRVRITRDDEVITLRSIQVTVGNGRYYGGGLVIAEDASIDDGRLDLYSLNPLSPWNLMLMAPSILRGSHTRWDAATCLSGTEFLVETKHRRKVNTDGELTTTTPVRYSLRPGALRVFVPAGADARGEAHHAAG